MFSIYSSIPWLHCFLPYSIFFLAIGFLKLLMVKRKGLWFSRFGGKWVTPQTTPLTLFGSYKRNHVLHTWLPHSVQPSVYNTGCFSPSPSSTEPAFSSPTLSLSLKRTRTHRQIHTIHCYLTLPPTLNNTPSLTHAPRIVGRASILVRRTPSNTRRSGASSLGALGISENPVTLALSRFSGMTWILERSELMCPWGDLLW